MSISRFERLALGVAAIVALASCQSGNARAPMPVTAITLDQIQSRLAADRAAGRVVVMHMWATWCGPCVEEFPSLARFYNESLADDRNVDFFAVSVDEAGDKEAVVRFVAESGARFPVFIADAPDQNAFARGINPAWPSVLPTTFLYGADGVTKDVVLGEIEDVRAFKKKIDAAKK